MAGIPDIEFDARMIDSPLRQYLSRCIHARYSNPSGKIQSLTYTGLSMHPADPLPTPHRLDLAGNDDLAVGLQRDRLGRAIRQGIERIDRLRRRIESRGCDKYRQ